MKGPTKTKNEEKGPREGQNKGMDPQKKIRPRKYQKRAYESLNSALTISAYLTHRLFCMIYIEFLMKTVTFLGIDGTNLPASAGDCPFRVVL